MIYLFLLSIICIIIIFTFIKIIYNKNNKNNKNNSLLYDDDLDLFNNHDYYRLVMIYLTENKKL